MKAWVSAQDIAAFAVFLASDAGAKILGQVLFTDGGTETLA
jgi:enoyl-[acyl-carrier-protein] reductase (NADH)